MKRTPENVSAFAQLYVLNKKEASAKPEIRLSEADKKRLTAPYTKPWREVLHWVDQGPVFHNPFKNS